MTYINTNTLQYPVSEQDIRDANPNTSFPASFIGLDLADFGYAQVTPADAPVYNPLAEYLQDSYEASSSGYNQVWTKISIPADQVMSNCIAAIQHHLDTVVMQRGYDSILSATSYAPSTHPVFQAEALACIAWRDSVWLAGQAYLAEVQAGTKPIPTESELLAILPRMVWPEGN